MSLWPLPLFPEGSLASSVITTVWVGVFIVCLMNLRFGWVLSGIVVPGYLVPLLIVKPVSALVVVAEAAITYGIFWLVSERLAHHTRWSSFFGRDRFLGLILISVAVRLTLDGWLLPNLADDLDRYYGLTFDWQNNLQSFGLVVVALMANQFYKPGLARGLVQSLVTMGLTYVVVRYGLMEATNFRIGAVVYLYEGFASSILASPKAYIILIVTCFIASRMNLRYGWDFGGIMIPALLALEWYQPLKIMTSFIEAFIIFGLGTALLRSRLFAGSTVEGARKILLFFNISFAYKLLLGHALLYAGVEQRITDYYGFGYLLPTLIAIKAHDKEILARVSRATAQISLTGALVGSLVGFVLTLGSSEKAPALAAAGPDQRSSLTAAEVALSTSGRARIDLAQGTYATIRAGSAEAFIQGIVLLDRAGPITEARVMLAQAGFVLRPLADGNVAVQPSDGAGFALIYNRSATSDIVVIAPTPAAAPLLGMAAYALFVDQDARWLMLGGRNLSRANPGPAPEELFSSAVSLPRIDVLPATGHQSTLVLAGSAGPSINLEQLLGSTGTRALALAEAGSNGSTLALSQATVQHLLAGRDKTPARTKPTYTSAELAFIRFDVLEPLLSMNGTLPKSLVWSAANVGLELTVLGPGSPGVVRIRRIGALGEFHLIRPRGSGLLLQSTPESQVVEVASRIFDNLPARQLSVVSMPNALGDPPSPISALLTQALAESSAEPPMVLQIRRRPNFGGSRGSVLAVDRIEPSGGFGEQMRQTLARAGLRPRLLQRNNPNDAGLEIATSRQIRYLQEAEDGRAALLWVDSAP